MNIKDSKQKQDFRNSISLLGSYLKSYEDGNALMYLPMSVELRKLLCEKKTLPLMAQIIPNVKFYKLHSTELFENNPGLLDGLQNFMPGRFDSCSKKLPVFTLSFSKSMTLVELNQWVNQIFFKENITICDLIKSVADKQGAHADKNYNDTLLHCKNWTFNNVECHILGIYGLTRFIYDFVTIEHKSFLI